MERHLSCTVSRSVSALSLQRLGLWPRWHSTHEHLSQAPHPKRRAGHSAKRPQGARLPPPATGGRCWVRPQRRGPQLECPGLRPERPVPTPVCRVGSLLTGVTQGFVDQPGKGFGFFQEFLGGLTGLERLLGVGASILAPPEMKEDTDEHQGDQQEFVKQEVWDHDGALSHGDAMSPSYLIFGVWNYPFSEHTRPQDQPAFTFDLIVNAHALVICIWRSHNLLSSNASNVVLASLRSAVSNPSLNHPDIG